MKGKANRIIWLCLLVAAALPMTTEAQSSIDSLRANLASQRRGKKRVNTLNSLLWEYYRKDNGLDSALKFGKDAFEESKRIRFDTGLVHSLNLTGLVWNKMGEKDSAIKYYLMGIDYGKIYNISQLTKTNYISLGRIYLSNNNLAKALVVLEDGRTLFEKDTSEGGWDRIMLQLINRTSFYVYQKTKNFNEAILMHRRNLNFYLSLPASRRKKENLAWTYQRMGETYAGLGETDSAVTYFFKCIHLQNSIPGQTKEQINAFCSLANEYLKRNELDSCRHYLMVAQDSIKQVSSPFSLSSSSSKGFKEFVNLFLTYGSFFNEMAEYDKALVYLDSALIVAELHDEDNMLDNIYYQVAVAYEGKRDWQQSLKFLRKADSLSKDKLKESFEISNDILKSQQKARKRELATVKVNEALKRINARNVLFTRLIIVVSAITLLASIIVIWVRTKANRELQASAKIIEDKNQALEMASRELEERNEEIQGKNTQLERLDSFKNEMIQRVYHDLRTPIYSIIENSQVAELPASQTLLNMESINRASRRILSLAESVLELERQKDDKLALKLGEYSIFQVVQDAFDQVFYTDSIRINVANYVGQSYLARFDRNYILWVLVNLLANAESIVAERMANDKEHEGFVEAVCQEDEENSCLWIQIKDSGKGIDLPDPNDIFDRSKVKGLEKSQAPRRIRSTGMGLAFVKKAIEDHGQKIRVESTKGKGTTFAFSLEWIQDQVGLEEKKRTEAIVHRFSFNNEEKVLADKLSQQLKSIPFYSFSKLDELIRTADLGESEALEKWREEVYKALLNQHKDRFTQLFELLES
ncbi:MAG: HAMP domain-containing histidine kinase [Bacteroidia bacterium]|nr:HAMP domain-containing histidine kinase [Bacteroidia bacterium]